MIPPPSFLKPWMRDKVRAPWRTQAGFHCLLASQSHQAFSHFLVFSRMVTPPPHLLPPGLSLRVLLPLPGMPPLSCFGRLQLGPQLLCCLPWAALSVPSILPGRSG